MKKSLKKLSLNRETLRNLTSEEAGKVAGGETSNVASECNTCSCVTCPGVTCQKGCGPEPTIGPEPITA
jgi:hypothetical protein